MLSINANLIIIFILVWLTVIILKKSFFDPIQRIRARRESLRAEEKAIQEKASHQAEALAQRIEAEFKEVRQEALARRQALEAEAMQARNELLAKVQAEYRQQVAQAKGEIAQVTQELKSQLEAEIEALAAKIEEKLLN